MAASRSQVRPPGRVLQVSNLPAGSDSHAAGSPSFVAYCLTGEVRAATRRNAIQRAAAAHRKASADDPYPTALILAQRLGVALEDLGRVVLGLQAADGQDPFAVLREARIDDLDRLFHKLADDPERLRTACRLPAPETTEDLDEATRAAALELSDALARRWHQQWSTCTAGWLLLRQIAKRMRHGAPLIPREAVLNPPGAGILGRELDDQFERWVLVADTDVDHTARTMTTEYAMADLSDETLSRSTQAGLEAVALARTLSGAHVTRVRTQSRWAFDPDALKLISAESRRALRQVRRG